MTSRYGTIILKPIAPKITTKRGVKQHTATIIVPTKEKPIKVIGILRWINKQKGEMNFMGGIEFTKIVFEDKWTLMDYAYDN